MSSGETVSGLICYAAAQVGTQFFDYTKVQAQIEGVNKSSTTARPVVLAREVISKLGFRQMWIGYDALVCRAFVYNYARIKMYQTFFERSASKDKYHSVSIEKRALYGAIAAGTAGFIASPFDLILLRKQVDHTLEQPRNYGSVFKAITQAGEKSFKDLWVASIPNSLKYGSMAWVMIQIYDSTIEFFPRIWGDVFFNKLAAVAVTSVFGTIASLPFDNVKTKLQWQPTGGQYKGFGDCWCKTLARETVFGFYTGFWFYTARNFFSAMGVIVLVNFSRGDF